MEPPNMNKQYYNSIYIPTSFPLNLFDLSDLTTSFAFSAPTLKQFESVMNDNEISKDDQIIIYDENIVMNATRVRWILKLFGF
jgi:3-mercaptopyruvate sulfurtransferase SseA